MEIFKFQAVLDSLPNGVLTVDATGRIEVVNKALCQLLNVSDDVIGRPVQEIAPGFNLLEGVESGLPQSRCKLELQSSTLWYDSFPLYCGSEVFGAVAIFKNLEGVKNNIYKPALAKVQDISDLRTRNWKRKESKTAANDYQETLGKEILERLHKDNVIVKSMGMLRTFALAIRTSQADSTVLLLGESGVGKEVLARVIHNASNRANSGNFIEINCGAIPENLLESELFGYEAGAFTGATSQGKPGMFELATKGTILLDEIGDLSMNLQVKLLRVLQDQVVYRLGGTKPIKLDVRIIAATNQHIWKMVQEGLFREDLFYRLNVLPIEVPPLRQRREDILPLTTHFIHLYNEKYGVEKHLDPGAIPIIENYNWPGNVRELQNIIERLLILTEDDWIQPWHVQSQLSKYQTKLSSPITISEILPIQQAKEMLEKQLITMALNCYPSIRKAAQVLGLDHSNVVRKVSKYGLKK